jgi:hypothetical protein
MHGLTLISVLRLGLVAPLRQSAFRAFVRMPLYLDMAPWNIVFLGPRLDYIDFDTKDRTYDHLVQHAYEVLEVLFNYKRTIQDFQKCAGRGGNPYNFDFVSECIGPGPAGLKCRDSAFPVPCPDGTCQANYVTCLRTVAEKDEADGKLGEQRSALRSSRADADKALLAERGGWGGIVPRSDHAGVPWWAEQWGPVEWK